MKNITRKILVICLIAVLCLWAVTLCACDGLRDYSDEIFIDDFSETYTISVKSKVRNHSFLPEADRYFKYDKGLDRLYETIISTPPYHQYVRKENDIIFIDLVNNGRTYSCIIYPSGEENGYIVHSLTYRLGDWADNRSIFFPAYSLDKEISYLDEASTLYQCSFGIEELKDYYIKRGYYATIKDNTLKVVCLLRYPLGFDNGSFIGDKAIRWSIVYEDTNTIRFADVANTYE